MFGGNRILVKAQKAPRRSTEPGKPEWERGELEEDERSSFWEEARGRITAFRQTYDKQDSLSGVDSSWKTVQTLWTVK